MTNEGIALVALAYREMACGCSTGARIGFDDLIDDLETGHESVTLLTMVASAGFRGLDWRIVRALYDQPEELSALVAACAELDSGRAEAILHVLAAGGRAGSFSLPAGLVLAAAERWNEVEEAMERWRALGIVTTQEEVFSAYVGAMQAATGRSRERILDDYIEATPSGYS